MKIGGYSAQTAVRAADRVRPGARTGRSTDAAAPASGAGPAVEVSDFFGVPEGELTPKVREALMGLMDEVDSLRRELQIAKGKIEGLEELADRDPLMPVANRRAFVREMSRMMSYTERYGVPSSLVFFDVNGLKQINDSLGHAAGDKALLAVATTLGEQIRDTDIVGRIGGDEFGVILAQADEDVARVKAQQLVDAIKALPVAFDGTTFHVDVAHGIFPFGKGDTTTSALAEADRRMYDRKREMKAAAAEDSSDDASAGSDPPAQPRTVTA
ncbi:MAG: GGDEF domain-containing protein [Minwuia sp.]|nr:GGDEF domain-containing protein [Minwuia sp.]